MRNKLAALLGALTLAILIPGMAFAHAPYRHAGHHGAWRRHGHHRFERLRDWSGARWRAPQPSSGTASGSSGTTSGSSGTVSGSSSSTSSGAGSGTAASSGGQTFGGYQVVRTVHLTATAYGPSAQDNYPYGATDYYGNALVAGDVAVDPSVIPLGTWLWVQGYSFTPYLASAGFLAHAVDTGGAIKGARIDLFVNEPDSIVNNFGIQSVTAYVLDKPASR